MNNDLERGLDQVQPETEHLQAELVEAIAVSKLRRVHVEGAGAEVLLGELVEALEEVKRYLGST
jgi:hypothetical protein